MSINELIIRAIKIEASLKPNEKLIIGEHVFTYSEFAEILSKKHNSRDERKLIKMFLKQAEQLFKNNMEFKNKILELAGVEK
ncbi:MAG: hypothetical protein QXZ14_12010 [Candidatus Jordarchaeales archaeon]